MLTVNLSRTFNNILVKAVVAAGVVVLIVAAAVIIATAVAVVVVAVVKKKFFFTQLSVVLFSDLGSTKAPGICEHAGVLAPFLGKISYAVQLC